LSVQAGEPEFRRTRSNGQAGSPIPIPEIARKISRGFAQVSWNTWVLVLVPLIGVIGGWFVTSDYLNRPVKEGQLDAVVHQMQNTDESLLREIAAHGQKLGEHDGKLSILTKMAVDGKAALARIEGHLEGIVERMSYSSERSIQQAGRQTPGVPPMTRGWKASTE
jgi:hypothetical protein